MEVAKSEANRAVGADASDQIRTDTIRIFVGGLGEAVTDNDLRRMFVALGTVDEIEIIRSKGRSMAYLNFTPSSAKSLAKLFSSFNGCVWKGGKLRIEKAKEHYLVKMEREKEKEREEEFARNEAVEKAKRVSEVADAVSVKKSSKGHEADKEQIRIFFPKLRKVKPLPFSGCGKHKYSFRNIPVPRLPTHFCDCEEHAVHYDAPIGTCEVDEKEFDLMHSVLNKFISDDGNSAAKAENSGANGNKGSSTVSDDILISDENTPNSEPDEDGIIINISGAMKETDFIWKKDDKKVSEYQVSNDYHPQPLEVVDKRLHNTNKKRKLGEGSNEISNQSLKKKKDDSNATSTLPVGINSIQAKKSKWKELVGVGSDSSFKLSNVLSQGAAQESVQQDDTEDESSKSEELDDEAEASTDDSTEDTEEKSSTSVGTGDEAADSSSPEEELSKSEESDDVVEEESTDELAKQDTEDESNKLELSEDEESSGELAKQNATEDESDKLEKSGDENEEEEESVDELAKQDTEDESNKLREEEDEMVEEEEYGGELAKQESTDDELDESDDIAEAVSDKEQGDTEEEPNFLEQLETKHGENEKQKGVKVNDKEDGGSVNKGATWSQIMPWTQLVSDLDNSSFSISQILPGGSSNQVASKPSLEIKDSSTGQSSKAVEVVTAPVSDDCLTSSANDLHVQKNLSNSADHSKTSNPTGAVKSEVSAAKHVLKADTYVPRPFVRCEASLKEWAKLKESIRKSRTKKRKTPEE